MGRRRRRRGKKGQTGRKSPWLVGDIIVWSQNRRGKACISCGVVFEGRRSLVVYQESDRRKGPLRCLDCAGMGDFVFLAAGDAKLTRRASKYSALRGVVVRRRRSFTERFGVLVEAQALERAAKECEVEVPPASFKRIAGTKLTMPPFGEGTGPADTASPIRAGAGNSSRTEMLGRARALKNNQQATGAPAGKPGRTAARAIRPASAPRSAAPKPGEQATVDRVYQLIRSAYPDCTKRRALEVAEYASSLPDTQKLLESEDSVRQVGILVSKYLRRRLPETESQNGEFAGRWA